MSLTGSSVLVLGGGCLGIPILAPTALEREKSSDWPMGWSRVVGLVGSEVAAAAGRAMTMHSTGRRGGRRRRHRIFPAAASTPGPSRTSTPPPWPPPLFPSLGRPIDPDGRSCCCEGWHDGRGRAATKRLTADGRGWWCKRTHSLELHFSQLLTLGG